MFSGAEEGWFLARGRTGSPIEGITVPGYTCLEIKNSLGVVKNQPRPDLKEATRERERGAVKAGRSRLRRGKNKSQARTAWRRDGTGQSRVQGVALQSRRHQTAQGAQAGAQALLLAQKEFIGDVTSGI